MDKQQTLLEKAKSNKISTGRCKTYTSEEIDLVLAWVNDEISLQQVSQALDKKSSGGVYAFLASVCRSILKKR